MKINILKNINLPFLLVCLCLLLQVLLVLVWTSSKGSCWYPILNILVSPSHVSPFLCVKVLWQSKKKKKKNLKKYNHHTFLFIYLWLVGTVVYFTIGAMALSPHRSIINSSSSVCDRHSSSLPYASRSA